MRYCGEGNPEIAVAVIYGLLVALAVFGVAAVFGDNRSVEYTSVSARVEPSDPVLVVSVVPAGGLVAVERFNATWRRVEPPEVYSTLPGEPEGLREALEEGSIPEKVTVACPGDCSAMPVHAEYAVFTGEEGRWDAGADGYPASAFTVPLEGGDRVVYGAVTGYAVYRGVALRLLGCNATHCTYTVTGTFTRMMTVEYVDVGAGYLEVPPPAGYTCLVEKTVPAGGSTIAYCSHAVKGPFYTIITSWLAPAISAASVAAAYAALRLFCRRSRAASTSSSTPAAT